jgi:hypothetical protein
MLKRRLSLIALLACLQAGTLAAQDRSAFGALPQSGDAAQPLPGGEKYTFGSIAPALPGGASLAPALEVIGQPEPPLRLRRPRDRALSQACPVGRPDSDGRRKGLLR